MSLLILAGLMFGSYKFGSFSAKNPGCIAGMGKALLGLFKK